MRLARFMARAGVEARRNCEVLILAGRVSVDRETITDPAFKVDPDRHDVRLDGEKLQSGRRAYFLLNKPRGYLCTNADPQGRKRVGELFPETHGRLFTVGRLDENSQGLLVVTNDGDLAERLAHPRYAVPKVYHVLVAGIPEQRFAEKLVRGMRFDEGIFRVRSAKLLKSKGQSSLLEITLTEGQNREIRRLLARLGHKVMRLERVALGPIKLGALPIGAYRPLLKEEVAQLTALLKVPVRPREKERRPDREGKPGGERTPEASVVQRQSQKAREREIEAAGPPGRRGRPGDRKPKPSGRPPRPAEQSRPVEQARPVGQPRVREPRVAVESEEGDTRTPPGMHPAIARATRGVDKPETGAATGRAVAGRSEGKRPAFKPKGRRSGAGGKPASKGRKMAAKRPGGKRKEY
jgi:23S rRNA pseudouridine2605 synthase